MTNLLTVRVRVFAALREALGLAEMTVQVAPGTDVAGLLVRLSELHPAAGLPARRFGIAVNRAYAIPTTTLADGDEIALIPPVSGGAGRAAAQRYEITDQPLSLDDVARRVSAPDRGGITVFAGTVRGITRPADGEGREFATDYLEYEAYAQMAEEALARIADEVQARWPAISAVSIVHRVGRLAVGDIAVVIAVAAAHRQDTFDACHYAIDRIKQVAPIWKKEAGPDGTTWVEGPESKISE